MQNNGCLNAPVIIYSAFLASESVWHKFKQPFPGITYNVQVNKISYGNSKNDRMEQRNFYDDKMTFTFLDSR